MDKGEGTKLAANLTALHEEVAGLRQGLDDVARVQREAALGEVLDALAPAAQALVRYEAGLEPGGGVVADALGRALAELGLGRIGRKGERIEVWPEEAADQMELDQQVPADAQMVRIEVLAPGWALDARVVARPVGRVIEVVQ